MSKHFESAPHIARAGGHALFEGDRHAVENAVKKLREQGYEFEYEETPNEILITHVVDGKERTTHLTVVSDLTGKFGEMVTETVMHPKINL